MFEISKMYDIGIKKYRDYTVRKNPLTINSI